MSTASKLGAAFGAGLLGFMLTGSPAMAGPNGQTKDNGSEATINDAAPGSADREVESGGSGTQGRSHSNPDDEGVDKPYAAAGQDAESQGESDYDGNNGCGNDTDFADDNNGKCGGLKKGHDTPDTGDNDDTDDDTDDTPSGALGSVTGDEVAGSTDTNSASVLGIQIERVVAAGVGATGPTASSTVAATTPSAEGATVLGVQFERGSAAALARTGMPLAALALLAIGLIGGGIAARRAAQS